MSPQQVMLIIISYVGCIEQIRDPNFWPLGLVGPTLYQEIPIIRALSCPQAANGTFNLQPPPRVNSKRSQMHRI